MADEDPNALVLDVGVWNLRIGLAGDDVPKFNRRRPLSSSVDSPHYLNWSSPDCLSGPGSCWREREGILAEIREAHAQLKREKVLSETEDLSHRGWLLCVDPDAPLQVYERICQDGFEEVNVPKLALADSCVLSSYASGRTSGLIVHGGESQITIRPVWEGYSHSAKCRAVPIAGRHVTAYLRDLLQSEGIALSYAAAAAVKERHGTVAVNFEASTQKTDIAPVQCDFTLADGERVNVELKDQHYYANELLFKPSLAGYDVDGLGWALHDTFLAVDIDTRRDLHRNVVLSGGLGHIPNIDLRLEAEMRFIDPIEHTYMGKPVKTEEAVIMPWIGGSILGSLSSFSQKWATKEEYDEMGPRIVRRFL